MKRSVFLWIVAILSAAFGVLMFLAPPLAAQAFNIAPTGDTDVIFRILGATLLSVGLMNFLVRNHPASDTLKVVLWTNISIHGLGTIADLWSIGSGEIAFSSVALGFVSHAIIGLGSLFYVLRMETV